jgi:hypothetical protein
MAVRNVISTLTQDGTEVMGPGVLMYHYPGNDIMNGKSSLLKAITSACSSHAGPS